MRDVRVQRIVGVALWAAVVAGGLVLSFQRFADAVDGDMGTDLGTFVHAAELLRSGESIYLEKAYVYSPFVAWMLAPFGTLDQAAGPWTALSIAFCWLAVAAVVATLWKTLRPWQRPVVAGAGLVTILWNYVLVLHLWLGQTDTLVLALLALGVFFASRRWAIASGIAVALTGIVKTWPAGFLLWFLRRDAPRRWWSLVAAATSWVVLLLLTLIFMGPRTFVDWIDRTLELSEQQLVAYSVFGLGRHLFTDNEIMEPLLVAPALGTAVGVALAAGIIALIVLVLRRPSGDSLSMWNLAGALVLLIPVSHIDYRLLVLPLLWVWLATALAERDPRAWAMTAVMALFWIVTFRIQPVDSMQAQGSSGHYVATMAIAVVALTASVLVAARRDRLVRDAARAEALAS
ncbi:MAG: glycosyltransferase family 87 protein [Microbacteriaceae bacterium]